MRYQMLGLFLVNPENEICLTQIPPHRDVVSMRYVPQERTCLLGMDDGTEEMIESQLSESITDVICAAPQLFVVHLNPDGSALKEYAVPITKS